MCSTLPFSPTPLLASPSTSAPRAKWVEILRTHAREGAFPEALRTYIDMTTAGVPLNHFAFPAALKSATGLRDASVGRQLHAAAVKHGYQVSPVTISNTLVTMYAKCGDKHSARKVFGGMSQRDEVSWNSIMAALCMFNEWELALQAFRDMQKDGFHPGSFSLVSVASACTNLNREDGLRLGTQLHAYGLRRGFYTEGEPFSSSALLSLYARVGKIDYSKLLFEQVSNRSLVSWNTMISSLVQNGDLYNAVAFFRSMIHLGTRPDGVTLASFLPACSHLQLPDMGKEIHAYALRNDFLFESPFVGSALVDMYCNCAKITNGYRVFRGFKDLELAIWNTMLSGFVQHGLHDEALDLFIELEVVGLEPSATTLASVIPACVNSENFIGPGEIHAYVLKRGFGSNTFVQNALMDMYGRISKVEASMEIFKRMKQRDVVSWNTIILGYIMGSLYDDAFDLFTEMQGMKRDGNGVRDHHVSSYRKPNRITIITVVPACATLAALAKGKQIHAYTVRNGLLTADVAVGSALVDMYAKSGCLTYSRRVFDQLPTRNVITWNALIMAYSMHGCGKESVKLLKEMVSTGRTSKQVEPNDITFISVLAACSHAGMVSCGLDLFHKLWPEYGVEPIPDHYACMVDLLGRSGRLEEAYQIIKMMDHGMDRTGAWTSLLGASFMHQNVKLGEIAANHLFKMEPQVASHYILLSKIYLSAGFRSKARRVRRKMKELHVRKEPLGCSWIEIGDKVHQFLVGDSSHPQSGRIHAYLNQLWKRMKSEGYIPDTSCVLDDVNRDEKEVLLRGHSEKLAIGFGLLNAHPGSLIRVARNLRICNDCHLAAKYISKILEREIIIRDNRRFHHFKNGHCSCGDYW